MPSGRPTSGDGCRGHRRRSASSHTSTPSRRRAARGASASSARRAAITAYAIGDYALALRELRTYRRISGSDDQIALMVDSERGVGRPDRALEVGRAVDRSDAAARRAGRARDRHVRRPPRPRPDRARPAGARHPRARIRIVRSSGARPCSRHAPRCWRSSVATNEAREWHAARGGRGGRAGCRHRSGRPRSGRSSRRCSKNAGDEPRRGGVEPRPTRRQPSPRARS